VTAQRPGKDIRIAVLHYSATPDIESEAESAANARLIAAAPDLLAALEEQLENTKGDLAAHLENGETEKDCTFLAERIAAMSAAISRAKGQA
jgi:hypothetical protein